MIEHVYPELKGIEPMVSDHSDKHIANVMKNVDHLLEDCYDELDGINLYCLGIIILFHDVGIIKGRKSHNKNIADVYNKVRNMQAAFNQERNLIIRAAEAHTGINAKDGSTDTLKDVTEIDHLHGYKVYLRELAALLRLADECAEGPQRTSDYLSRTDAYGPSSKYHEYASITEPFIDKGGQRIVLTYNIDISSEKINSGWVKTILEFTFKRILKLDTERKYCRYYTQKLFPFKKTEANISFSIDGIPQDLPLPPIILTDNVTLPLIEDAILVNEIEAKDPLYVIDSIVSALQKKIPDGQSIDK